LTRRYRLPILLGASVVAADLATKKFAADRFADGDLILIPGFLRLTYVENPGAAFSLFGNAGPFLGVAALVVTALVLWALLTPRPRLEVIAFGLIIGGALGNFFDRLFRGDGFLDGKVIDWVDLWWIPTFNVADSSITIAVALLLIHAWRIRAS
jgi:signal peptidase II